ncbi:MAG: hypothetical protein ACOYOO_13430, partial [Saprospiraceae bacterium]
SNLNLARSAMKRLFTQPQYKILPTKAAKDFLHNLNTRKPDIISRGNDLLNRYFCYYICK